MMVLDIISAIARAISGEFGDGFTIYSEAVGQNLKEPCFFISCIRSAAEPFPGKRYFWENLFVIQFFPKEGGREKEECNTVSEQLFDCLELIELDDGAIRGTDLHGEITDGVLSFFVNYNLFTYKKEDVSPMEELKRKITKK